MKSILPNRNLEQFSFDADFSVDLVQTGQRPDVVPDGGSGVIPVAHQKFHLDVALDRSWKKYKIVLEDS